MGKQDENISDDDLDMEGLSDEERAALEDDDDESEILKGIAGDDEADDEKGDDDDGGEDDPAAAGADDAGDADDDVGDAGTDAAADADAGAAKQDDGPAAADKVAPEFQPEFRADVPEGLEQKISELDSRTATLLEKFKSGEIELPDFMAQKGEIDAERLTLTLAAKQAEWAKSQNEDARAQRWKWEQERFFGLKTSDIYKDPIVLAALNASVKQLAADPKNASKPSSYFLEEADRQVRARFGGQEQKPNTKTKLNTPDMSKLPKTLANLPAADMSETGSDEFAYLDKLDGLALERALSKLTPEQEARYLGAAA